MRLEGLDLGVRVSTACPGYIHTTLIDRLRTYNADAKDVIATIPVARVKPDAAARLILQGVEKNRAIIKFPSYVGLLTFLYRFVPSLFARQSLKTIRDFRKIRKEGKGETFRIES